MIQHPVYFSIEVGRITMLSNKESRIVFYVSNIYSRTMYVEPMEGACKGDSNHTKYSKSSKFDFLSITK